VAAGSQSCSSGVADQKEALKAWANHPLAVEKRCESISTSMTINNKGKNCFAANMLIS
jgi:hypothetical protein